MRLIRKLFGRLVLPDPAYDRRNWQRLEHATVRHFKY